MVSKDAIELVGDGGRMIGGWRVDAGDDSTEEATNK